jgi:hypothetical protein
MHQRAFVDFREAVRDLSDEPSALNVQRYLAASRTLELSAPKKRPARTSRRPRAKTTIRQGVNLETAPVTRSA